MSVYAAAFQTTTWLYPPFLSSATKLKTKTKPFPATHNTTPNGVRMTPRVKAKDLGSGGTSVLERPAFDQSQFDPSSQVLEGGDMGRLREKRGIGSGDSYRVLLIDDVRHSEKLVARVLPQVVPSITPDHATKLFHESRRDGVALVIVAVKEHAEFYVQMMIQGGLRSVIEPDSST